MDITQDPTREELNYRLNEEFASSDLDNEEAIYWFAYNYHSGQNSNLYSVLSTSPFRPGAFQSGPERRSLSAMMFEFLESIYDY